MPPIDDTTLTRTDATKFLSTEFIVGLFFQTVVFLVIGGIAWGQLKAEVTSVKDVQDTSKIMDNPAKIASIEAQLSFMNKNQSEMKSDIKDLVVSVDQLKDEVRRSRK